MSEIAGIDLGPCSVLEIRLNGRVIQQVEFQPDHLGVAAALRVAALALEAQERAPDNVERIG